MGLCNSCESAPAVTAPAKLIFDNGRLEEFPYPIKAVHVLQRNPTCFICNSDELEFDDVVPAVGADDDLLPGHIYFALPLSRLNRRLRPEEIAALAVKASAALVKSRREIYCGCRRKAVEFSVDHGLKKSRKVAWEGERGRRRGGGAAAVVRRRGKFTARLAAITE
ncbi:uncharacterized protein LOC127240325 [Andrographis paniculata]|uniref:uncharacterized protein LOC127240325 n=1 Tax=Andrographis paniculata TaxID=175694 RepID=UPI0021E8A49D|nr:uncharacterized protein LOC127240325 [Andrographis paniculata]